MIGSKVTLMMKFIEKNPRKYGRYKHKCIVDFLYEEGLTTLSDELSREIQTLDRAWRKALELCPELDYRGCTIDAENAVKRDLGYG